MRYGYALLLGLVACVSYDTGDLSPWQIEMLPASGATDVVRNVSIRVLLDRRLAPYSVTSSSVRLHSGRLTLESEVRYDPVTREMWVTPLDLLDANVAYALDIQGLVDLDGTEQEARVQARFATGSRLRTLERDEQAPPDTGSQAAEILRSRCTDEGCHGSTVAAQGLVLGAADGIRTSALGVVGNADRTAPVLGIQREEIVRLSALPIIDVSPATNRAARSYLLYKMLDDAHIDGRRMPPPPLQPLTQEEIRAVQEWIEQGASLQYFQ